MLMVFHFWSKVSQSFELSRPFSSDLRSNLLEALGLLLILKTLTPFANVLLSLSCLRRGVLEFGSSSVLAYGISQSLLPLPVSAHKIDT